MAIDKTKIPPKKSSGNKIVTGQEPQQEDSRQLHIPEDLTPAEMEFIMIKLKEAPFIGKEFEQFWAVYRKLFDKVEYLKQKS